MDRYGKVHGSFSQFFEAPNNERPLAIAFEASQSIVATACTAMCNNKNPENFSHPFGIFLATKSLYYL
jgi:hypothetical protein